MTLSERLRSNLELVLEETCRRLPHGGDHGRRKVIAQRLLEAAAAGHTDLGELRVVAQRAFARAEEITRQ
jgi:hypothetical protein